MFHILFRFFLFTLFCSSTCGFCVPVILNVNPTNLPTTALAPITITGTGFSGATSVDFGDEPSLAFIVDSDTTITATPPVSTPATVHITVTTPDGTSAETPADYFTYTGSPWISYTTLLNQLAVTPLPLQDPLVAGAPIGVGFGPVGIAITPDGKKAYVANSGANSVSVLDLVTNTFVTNIAAGTIPQFVAIAPDGARAYVTNVNSQNVSIIDVATDTNIGAVFVGPIPQGIAITPDGTRAFIATNGTTALAVLDLTVEPPVLLDPITLPMYPQSLAITPDGTTLIAVGQLFLGGLVSIPLTSQPYVAGPLVDAGNNLVAIAITQDGTTAYTVDSPTNSVIPFDLTQNPPVPLSSFPTGSSPNGISISPDGTRLLVANSSSSSLTVFTLPSMASEEVIVGTTPTDIAITPDQPPVARFSATVLPPGFQSSFDASASVSPTGTISLYTWNFGDATPDVFTTSPLINHTYTFGGSFTVTLTVTNSAGTSSTQIFTGRTVSNNGGPSAVATLLVEIDSTISPPQQFTGKQIANRFLTQTDYVNILTWTKPADGQLPQSYAIFRNAELTDLVAVVSSFEYADHNRRKGKAYTYYIVSIGVFGAISSPASITVLPKGKHSRLRH